MILREWEGQGGGTRDTAPKSQMLLCASEWKPAACSWKSFALAFKLTVQGQEALLGLLDLGTQATQTGRTITCATIL